MLTKRLAYEKWLGIKEEHQPPSLYRLLAIDAFESDQDTIANAADSRTGFVRQFQIGENSKIAAEILNELSRARIILLNPQKKAAYDAQLRRPLASNRADPWDRGPDQQLSSAAASPVASPGGKPLPQARAIGPLEAIPIVHETTTPEVDVELLVSESASVGSRKPKTKTRQPKRRLVAVLAGAGIVAGCVIAGLAFFLVHGRQAAQSNTGNNSVPNNRSKPTATNPDQDQQAKAIDDETTATSATAEIEGPAQATPAVAELPKPMPSVLSAQAYDGTRLQKDVDEIKSLSKAVKTPDESRTVAEKAIVLADRAIALENTETAKAVAVISLAAARNAESVPLARRATVLLIQLQGPLPDAVKRNAKRRLAALMDESPAEPAEETLPTGPSLHANEELAGVAASHDARWGKTEAERRKIFFDLLKAVDDHGMTPEGKKAWKEIQARNGIDSRVTLGILNEGFGTFSDWDQPDSGGRASGRINRINWIGMRTRSMTEPMLTD